jgi:HIV Tat-specific factor 1
LNGSSSSSTSASAAASTSTSAPAPIPAPAANAPAPKKTAVWVTNLPPNATPSKIASVFSKAGVLLDGDDGQPRIKLYYDDEGNFKGEALVMYFKEGSVTLAETLLDDTELELGSGYGNMRVKVAEYEKSNQKTNEEKKVKKDEGEKVEKKKLTAEEKQRMTKRIKRMQE